MLYFVFFPTWRISVVHHHFRIVLNPHNDLYRGLWDLASIFLLSCVSTTVTLHPAFDALNYKCAYWLMPLGLCTCCYLPLENSSASSPLRSSFFSFLLLLLSLQSCPTLYDPIDGSPPGSPIPGILQARTLEWVAISFSSAWKWNVKVKSLSHVRLLGTPWSAAYQAPPSMGFFRQEYWSGVPLPSLLFNLFI